MAEDFATVPPGCKKIQGETFLKFICLYVFVTVSVYMACTFCESTTCQGSAWRKWITMEIQAAHLGCTKRHSPTAALLREVRSGRPIGW